MSDFTGLGLYSSRDLVVEVSGNATFTFEDLHIMAECKRALSANPNEATISIYNLNETTRDALSSGVYDNDDNKSIVDISVILNGEQIYKGNIINAVHNRSNVDGEYVSIFYCGDGSNAFKAEGKKVYPKGTNVAEIVGDVQNEIAKAGNLTKGIVQGLKDCTKNRSIARSITINGNWIENIQKLLKDCTNGDSETDTIIADGQVNVLGRNEVLDVPVDDLTKTLLSPPSLTEQGSVVECILNTELVIGASFTISSKNNKVAYANLTVNRIQNAQTVGIGTYKISEIVHKVDNFTKDTAVTIVTGILLRG